ncbi:MAG: hypothetical protein CMO55_20680 [Verrucomicrobiales bacterium]|nr:hypothetical protein [Verrucomicrobiales bacterium]
MRGLAFTLTMLLFAPAFGVELKPDEVEFFESRIRPILAQECYECHSEATKSKGGLLLDSRVGWQKGGESGDAIVPGSPEQSLLLQTISHELEDLQMPKAGAKLDESIVSDFRKWISMGAPDPRDAPPTKEQLEKDTNWEAISARRAQWWSFQPIKKPEVPQVGTSEEPIDRFIQKRLNEEGLSVSPKADPRTLHRRLAFHLVGLPPTREESEAFLAAWEKDPDKAIKERVASYLDDPAFGEKWARHFMDWTRYADSHGSEGDPDIPHAWRYRDYLIRAWNEDIPYDQLVLEHLAGDLLENPRINEELGLNESAIGTAHLRMVFHGFAPTDALDERVRFTDDQINSVTKGFMGLTVSCARCHNHKFDAISQADYYSLFGIFTAALPATVAVDAPGVLETNRDALAELKPKIRKEIAKYWSQSFSDSKRWKKAAKEAFSTEHVLHALHYLESANGPEDVAERWKMFEQRYHDRQSEADKKKSETKVRRKWELSDPDEVTEWTAVGEGLEKSAFARAGEFVVGSGDAVIQSVLPAGVYSHQFSTKHRGMLASPPLDLDGKYDLFLSVAGDAATARYAVQHYPRRGTVYPITELEKGDWRWVKYDRLDYWDGDRVHLELTTAGEAPIHTSSKERSWFGIREAWLVEKGAEAPAPSKDEKLAPVFGRETKVPTTFEEGVQHYQRALALVIEKWGAGQELTDSEALFLDGIVRAGVLPNRMSDLKGSLKALVVEYRKLEGEIPQPTRAPGLIERPGRDYPLFVRGNHKEPGDPVPRRFLEELDSTPYNPSGSGRLDFARDMLRDDNPFTARVIVNRIWHHLFGQGLVPTADNFGRLGEEPSHPELLDYLASQFREKQDWSMKSLIREIVLSDTWQQASLPSKESLAQDPGNKLLSHYSVQRLEAEAIRDSILAVSGDLDEKMFGGPVGGDTPRRSIYLKVKRNNLDPLLTTFDFPTPASTVGRRDSTNVPAQSLTLLNDPFIIKKAGSWAKKLPETASEKEKIRTMFLKALNREPSELELEKAIAFLEAIDADHAVNAEKFTQIESELSHAREALAGIVDPVRARLLEEKKKAFAELGEDAFPAIGLEPVAFWDFEDDVADKVGEMSGTLHGTARLEEGALVVDGNGFVSTQPLDVDLTEKTLEAVVQLDNLTQKGGGVMTVQNLGGNEFDSIVFAERKNGEWLSGSERHVRTLDFGAPAEMEALERPVHLTITYEKDGTITCYRDGEKWGDPIRKAPVKVYPANQSEVLFGLRHGKGVQGNKPIQGRIFEARLYDRALAADEVMASFSSARLFVSERSVTEALSPEALEKRSALEAKISELESRRDKLVALGSNQPLQERRWQDLAHAIFNLKEFIYLQ